jgi:hypothetical protein
MFQFLKRHRTAAVLVVGLALAATACGSASAGSKVASLGGSDSGATATTTPLSNQDAVLKFVACLRQNGLNVPDPTFDANGNVQGRIFGGASGVDPRSDANRAAIQKCRSLVGNVGFGPGGGRFNPQQMQAAFNDYTSCLRQQGLDVKDVTFGPRGDSGAGAAGGPPAGDTGPRDGGPGFGPGGGGNGSGPRGQGFDPTRMLARRLGLDTTDPKVKAAMTACQSIITKAFAQTTTTTVAN